MDRPVNVVARPGCPPVAELAALGVRRISVGGWFTLAALGAAVEAADQYHDHGTYGYLDPAQKGATAVRSALRRRVASGVNRCPTGSLRRWLARR